MRFFSTFLARTFTSTLAALSIAALAGCGSQPRDEQYNPRHFHVAGDMLPSGVEGPTSGIIRVPVGRKGPRGNIEPAPTCCSVRNDARFHVAKTAAQHALHLWLGAFDQSHVVSVTFPGFSDKVKRQSLTDQSVEFVIAVPSALKTASGSIAVDLRCVQTDPKSTEPCALTSAYFE